MQNRPKLDIVIPVFNEQDSIEKVVRDWEAILREFGLIGTIIIVNDGSTDNSLEILKKLEVEFSNIQIINRPNSGHGASILYGYETAIKRKVDYVFQCDSDDQIPAKEFPRLWSMKDQSEFILGVRKSRHDPIVRIFISRVLSLVLYLLFKTRIKDANTPFRLMSEKFLTESFNKIQSDCFAPNIFFSVIAFKTPHIHAMQVSIFHQKRNTGNTTLVSRRLLKACFDSLWQLVKFSRKLARSNSWLNIGESKNER